MAGQMLDYASALSNSGLIADGIRKAMYDVVLMAVHSMVDRIEALGEPLCERGSQYADEIIDLISTSCMETTALTIASLFATNDGLGQGETTEDLYLEEIANFTVQQLLVRKRNPDRKHVEIKQNDELIELGIHGFLSMLAVHYPEWKEVLGSPKTP